MREGKEERKEGTKKTRRVRQIIGSREEREKGKRTRTMAKGGR